MIQEELKQFIEQNCSGREPSELTIDIINKKIKQLGADSNEVLAFVDECIKGPTLEQKAEIARRAEETEAERRAQEEMAKLKEQKINNYGLFGALALFLVGCILLSCKVNTNVTDPIFLISYVVGGYFIYKIYKKKKTSKAD